MRAYIERRAELAGLPGVITTAHLHKRLAYRASTDGRLLDKRSQVEINHEIRRLVAAGDLHRIKRGIYVRTSFLPGGEAELGAGSLGEMQMLLAAALYGPSYVSAETALRIHGYVRMGAVAGGIVIHSVTAEKNRTKVFDTAYGRFCYNDIPPQAFAWGVETRRIDLLRGDEYGGGVEQTEYRLAGAEKALCDAVYLRGRRRGLRTIMDLLYDEIGVDPNELRRVNIELIWEMQHLYPSSGVRELANFLYRYA